VTGPELAELAGLTEELARLRAELVTLRGDMDALDRGVIEASMAGSRAQARAEALQARVADGGPVPGQARRRLAVVPPGGAA